MSRLMTQGLSRHDVLHAIGSVVADIVFESVNTRQVTLGAMAQLRCNAAVEELNAKEWKRRHKPQ